MYWAQTYALLFRSEAWHCCSDNYTKCCILSNNAHVRLELRAVLVKRIVGGRA
jgi:hypothetical protein